MLGFCSSGEFVVVVSPSLFVILIFNFLNVLLFFYIDSFFAFPTVLFPLKLIFNIYKSSLSTSI